MASDGAAIAALEKRVALLERQAERDLGLIDGNTQDIAATKALEEFFVIPTILLLAGFGHRALLAAWLAELAVAIGHLGDEAWPGLAREQSRVSYWRDQMKALEKNHTWQGFPPHGFDDESEADSTS